MDKKISKDLESLVLPILQSGGIGVLPTDTLYGVVGSAMKKDTVERIYGLRKRDLKKPMIVLIQSTKDLDAFAIRLDSGQKKILEKIWPGKVSVVLPCSGKRFEHLHRGKQTMAFRVPAEKWLRDFLRKTGPLVAPSANMAGEKPAQTYAQARKYFSNDVDFYVDFGKLDSTQSTLIILGKKGEIDILRKGAARI